MSMHVTASARCYIGLLATAIICIGGIVPDRAMGQQPSATLPSGRFVYTKTNEVFGVKVFVGRDFGGWKRYYYDQSVPFGSILGPALGKRGFKDVAQSGGEMEKTEFLLEVEILGAKMPAWGHKVRDTVYSHVTLKRVKTATILLDQKYEANSNGKFTWVEAIDAADRELATRIVDGVERAMLNEALK
jgi:hypothetical protein